MLSEKEMVARVQQLKLQVIFKGAELRTQTGELIAIPNTGDMFADLPALEKLNGELNAKLGRTDDVPATKANAPSTKPQTATEKLLAAKGCKNLSELRAKTPRALGPGQLHLRRWAR